MLYLTTHNQGEGGELVVANNRDARTKEEVDADCQVFYPQAGHLVLFDARQFPQYVRALNDPNLIRIAAAMNLYTSSCSEKQRPADLNKHLYGRELPSLKPRLVTFEEVAQSLHVSSQKERVPAQVVLSSAA